MFQTPAPRGGVPLPGQDVTQTPTGTSFKPLRLGAVFLWMGFIGGIIIALGVSNPCASGRCSSVSPMAKEYILLLSFKPLRLGAVFLCWEPRARLYHGVAFQTPAPRGGVPLANGWGVPLDLSMFQTPAPRGGVPLVFLTLAKNRASASFQTPAPRGGVPLRCILCRGTVDSRSFQTPAPRGGVPLRSRIPTFGLP